MKDKLLLAYFYVGCVLFLVTALAVIYDQSGFILVTLFFGSLVMVAIGGSAYADNEITRMRKEIDSELAARKEEWKAANDLSDEEIHRILNEQEGRQ